MEYGYKYGHCKNTPYTQMYSLTVYYIKSITHFMIVIV